jgi:fused signal recognition particle receptor
MSDTTPKAPRSGFFSKVKRGLFMTHTEILEKLGTAVKKGLGFDETVLESLEEALIDADAGADTAAALADAVRARTASAERTDLEGLRALLIEEIERLLSQAPSPGPPPQVPLEVVFLVGVNGSGKTTTTAKLAARRRERGQSVMLAAADTFRAGAIEQLAVWAERVGAPIIRHREGADPSAVLFDAIAAAKARGIQVLLVDTAGRLHTKKNLMEELAKMRRIAAREVPGAPHPPGARRHDRGQRARAGAQVRGGRGRDRGRADQARRQREGRGRPGDHPRAEAPGPLRRGRRGRRGSGSVRPG